MDFFFVICSTLFLLFISYLRHKYQYWEQRGVPQLQMNFFYGNFFRIKTMHKTEIFHEVYKKFRGKAKLVGTYVFTKPVAVVLDLDLVKSILIKDFNKIADRFEQRKGSEGILHRHLLRLDGERWRPLRTKLTPTFTSAKMKFMFPTLVTVAQQLEEAFSKQLTKTSSGDVELHDLMGRFTTDVIGHCVFGVDCNSLKDPNVVFRRMGRRIFYPKYFSIRLHIFMTTYPALFKYLKFFNVQEHSKDLEDFMVQLVSDTVRLREEQNIHRNDFIDLLIELKNSKDTKGMSQMSIEVMVAQVYIFFAAGYETSSSNLSNGLYELAKNPHVQEKLRAEIKSILEKHNGELTYEAMMEMTYLDQVITETLRMHPAIGALTRVSIDDYKIPDTDITLEKGTHIYIPVSEIHYDPAIYDNPKEFRPERFHPDEMQKRHPQAFLGFGDGPRNCIGLRFGRMQVRVGFITLLKSYRFSLSEKTPTELEISKYSIVLVPHSKIWLKAEKL
ncbi:probable cytochrome P450 6a13 isoform X3 [Bactrocera dorsalis]|uniref:Probable cytochrome P450 6a13 isoform X3 n=1 Tax=Bactrocera dorsalis TaxID=27457 RepID=A0ABM3JWY5_BACDO|nr:probable cytochrome P450 6a13 isoform X3 [Bactrocera dorsalis]